ncbi:hypothetical protein [Paractinoplanes rishiriensis]|uniref:hypothetical protein n=1 Tax=Paractinoplanes rishiriensis TaxID=1050105 RepID=UPI00194228BF|nr:hypothetical protein [Actinoplanes rishiriensis]
MAVTQQQTTTFLRARAAAAFADLQVILMRDLAGRLRTCGTPAEHTLGLEAAADQLEASAREAWRTLRPGATTPG